MLHIRVSGLSTVYAPIKQTKMAIHVRLVNNSKWSKGSIRVHNGMVNLDVFDNFGSFGSIWTLLDLFRQKSIWCPIKTK